jgi:cellobiose-specific phosphotransferase system component IIB
MLLMRYMMEAVKKATISADVAAIPSATYSQAEIESILMELRDLKNKLRTAGILAA